MKYKIVGVLLFLLNYSAFANDSVGYQYNDFLKSPNQTKYIEKQINNHPYLNLTVGQSECEKVVKFAKLGEDTFTVYMQVSCKNIHDDLYILMPKPENANLVINSCKNNNLKFEAQYKCGDKLK